MSDHKQEPEQMAIIKSAPQIDQAQDSPGYRMRQKILKKPERVKAMVEEAREKTRSLDPKEKRKLARRKTKPVHPILRALENSAEEGQDHADI